MSAGATPRQQGLKRAFVLFVEMCKDDQYHCQPEAEEILFLAYGIVTGKTDRDTLTLQTMIKDLHRHYPDYQATAVVKRSRMKARKEHLRHASELLP